MINEKNNTRTEALYNDEKTHRFILRKAWDNAKPGASVIMIAPSRKANEVMMDMTSLYVVNNCFQLGFGSVEILNLYSGLDGNKLATTPDNDEWIQKSCHKANTVILAWGKGQTSKEVTIRIQEVVSLLEPYRDKLQEIADKHGRQGFHPLHASVRLHWELKPFVYPIDKMKQEP